MDARTAPADDRTALTADTGPARVLAGLTSDAAARALAATSDVALIIDADGIIRDIAVGTGELADAGLEIWLNRPWSDTVLAENSIKITELLAGTGTPGRWRQVNHALPGGELPIRYLAMPAGADGNIVAVGRDMRSAAALQQRLVRAQQSMERDSLRLRQLEARYRLLFDSAQEAIIIVDATTRRIVEANPAARRLTGLGTPALEGLAFSAAVHPDDRDAATALLGAVAAAEQRHPGRIRLESGQDCQISATLFRQDRGTFLLVRLRPFDLVPESAADRSLNEVLERMPDAFVLTDASLLILACNGAFLDLVDRPRAADVRGQPLTRFIGRPGIDVGVFETQLRDHGLLRNFATVVRRGERPGERPGERQDEVEISAVTSEEGGEIRHGLSIRVPARAPAPVVDDRQTPRSVEQLTELVGRVSLKEIVRESTDLIERLCIEAALTYTSDNRASAAEILGLSRQSLYSKLHRHGLGNLSDTD